MNFLNHGKYRAKLQFPLEEPVLCDGYTEGQAQIILLKSGRTTAVGVLKRGVDHRS